MNLYKKCSAKPCLWSVIDATAAPDNSLRFKKNRSERLWKLIMTIYDRIRD